MSQDSLLLNSSDHFKKWLNCFVKSDYKLIFYETYDLEKNFFNEVGTLNLNQNSKNDLFNKSKKYILNLQLSYSVKVNDKNDIVIEGEGPDSFVDLFSVERKSGLRVFHTGTTGEVDDVFWINDNVFAILSQVSHDGSSLGESENEGYIDVINLKLKKEFKYKISKEFMKQNVNRDDYIIKTFANRLYLFE